MTKRRHPAPRPLGPVDRAVYALAERGISAAQAPLYQRQLSALSRAGLVRKQPDGSYVHAETPVGTGPAPALEEPMAVLVVRIPAADLRALDEQGPNRSDAARAVIARGLGRGRARRAGAE